MRAIINCMWIGVYLGLITQAMLVTLAVINYVSYKLARAIIKLLS